MEENKIMVPYIVHESELARAERTINRLWALIALLVLLNVFSLVRLISVW